MILLLPPISHIGSRLPAGFVHSFASGQNYSNHGVHTSHVDQNEASGRQAAWATGHLPRFDLLFQWVKRKNAGCKNRRPALRGKSVKI
jgi:hypothetical protein